jgi:hypothetical protein
MHPLRKLRESGQATPAQVSALLAALKDKLPPDVWDYPTA